MITISVPAKIHMLGEHSVVYGKPALLAAINKRVFVTIASSKTRKISGIRGSADRVNMLLKILEAEVKKRFKFNKIAPYSISIKSEIPVGSGLGSSAALSASLTAAILSFLKIPLDKKIVFEIAYTGEKYFHGNPSGGDLAAVIEGGFLWFRKEFEFLKTFSPLPFKPHKNIKQFVLINSGIPEESTKEMVEKVAKLKAVFSQKIELLFNSQEALTKRIVIALEKGDESDLVECIKFGERNLEELGVAGKKAQSMIRKIEKLGGAAKINGGGGIKKGSGMILAYHKNPDVLNKFFLHSKLENSKITLGEEGLRRDE
jgi:mevalonate kinase